MGTESFSGVVRPKGGADHLPHLAQWLMKSKAKLLLPVCAFMACCSMNFTFTFIGEVSGLKLSGVYGNRIGQFDECRKVVLKKDRTA